MKDLLKKILPRGQYEALVRVKHEVLPDLSYKLRQLRFLLVGYVIKILPDKSLVSLKSRIKIVKKMDYQHHDIFLNVDSDFEYRIRLHSCKKEPKTVEWIESFFREGDVLYDVGANVGAYSLVAAKIHRGKVRVYAFEPAFLNFAQLCKNLILNGCQGIVIPLQIALSDKTSIMDFNYRNLIPGGALHAVGEAISPEGDAFIPVARQPVLTYRADDLVREFHTPIPTHIKIDVDGTELYVLRGMNKILEDRSVQSIRLELNAGRGHGSQVIQLLARKGFEAHWNLGSNYIFLRKF